MFLKRLLFNPPDESFFRFSSQGKGINWRANNYTTDWGIHYENSKRCIDTWLRSKSSASSLNILGAGPLNDISIDSIENFAAGPFKKLIIITDANIDFLKFWKLKLKRIPFQAIVQDVSLRLESWLSELQQTKFTSYDNFLSELDTFSENQKNTTHDFYKGDLNISLNLLSQIPIHWQEAIFTLSRKKFGTAETNRQKENLLLALNKSSSFLIESHLNQLIPNTKNRSNLIIFDYKYYFPDTNLIDLELTNETSSSFPKPIFHFKNSNDNLILEQDPLFTFDIANWLTNLPNSIKWNLVDNWIWKVVPNPSAGETTEFHIVICLELSRA